MQQEVGVLDAFGNALVGGQLTDVILRQKVLEVGFGDVGINGQGGLTVGQGAESSARKW
ncbi:hypothetical protein D3C71_1089950 [compost metagenome]